MVRLDQTVREQIQEEHGWVPRIFPEVLLDKRLGELRADDLKVLEDASGRMERALGAMVDAEKACAAAIHEHRATTLDELPDRIQRPLMERCEMAAAALIELGDPDWSFDENGNLLGRVKPD